ncbi:hypothetical protein BT93_F2907 [Corymbia citriodora subsp. variegata]|nr:hypothetical protein BT93_F2907 [Corymbia citriodora subsp. variegata]
MTQLLLGLVLMEMALIVVLRFERFLGESLAVAVILVERRGRFVTRNVATTMVVIFSLAIYHVLCIMRKSSYANNFLQTFLIGFSLLLGISLCWLHHSVARQYMLRRGALLQWALVHDHLVQI